MPKLLVTGGSGFIGKSVCKNFNFNIINFLNDGIKFIIFLLNKKLYFNVQFKTNKQCLKSFKKK